MPLQTLQPAKDSIRVLEEPLQFSDGHALCIKLAINSPQSKLDQANNFEYRGWHVQLEVTGSDSSFSGHAILMLDGEQKCRLGRL